MENWNILLELALELQRICEKYHLKYFLHAGSLLGAVRHSGFIPWDDDMDFILPRADYDQFLLIAEKEIKPPFYLQTMQNSQGIFNNGRTLLRRDNTTGVQFIRDLYCKEHQGIAIDILALDECSGNEIKRVKQWKRIDKYAGMLYLRFYGKKTKAFSILGWGKLKTRLGYYLSQMIPLNILIKRWNKYATLCKENSDYCTSFQEVLGNYRHIVLEKNFFSENIMIQFENCSFPVPIGYKEILTKYYGENYMELPPEEQRKGHHYQIQSINESYDSYLSHFQDIFLNTKGKKIIVFGAGKMFLHFLKHTKKKYHPVYIVDNNKEMWGHCYNGFYVKNPECIREISKEERYIIICSIYYKEIIEQLEGMGVNEYFIYVQNPNWL